MAKVQMRQFLWAAALAGSLILPALAGEPAGKAPQLAASIAPHATATIEVAYDLRYLFIPFGRTIYRGVFRDHAYQASSYFKTSGLVSVFWQSEIDAGASGNIGATMLSPYVYDSYAKRSAEKRQRVKLTYRAGQPPKLFAQPAYNTKKYPVSIKEQESGIDPMSAVTFFLSGLSADAKNPCGTVAPVFDGKRRYNIAFTYVMDQPIKLGKLYKGRAHLCRIRYHQIAGYKQTILNHPKRWPPIYALVADIPDASAPCGHYVVPLKLWADTDWGRVTAELTALKTSGGKAAG